MRSFRKWKTMSGWIRTTYMSVTVAQTLTALKTHRTITVIDNATSFLQDSRRHYEMEVRNQAMVLERQLRRGESQVSLDKAGVGI